MERTLFEHTIQFDEDSYRAIWQTGPRRGLRFVVALLIGVLMVLWSYTLLAGVVVLTLCLIHLVSPGLLSKGLRSNFRGLKYMHQPLRYGVSGEYLWVQGRSIDARASWPLLATWRFRNNWLILSASGIPQVYLPIAEMKTSGVYDDVLALATKNGREFK